MKKILTVLLFLSCSHSFASQAPSFGIYLLQDESLDAYKAIEIGLQSIKLKSVPLWGIQDFKSYNCLEHKFELTPQGENQIPEGQLRGLPFVFVANDSRIYLGAFWTSFSSFEFGYPIIDTEWFKITGELKISRSYPHEGVAVGTDPRASSEIIEELKVHHILKDSCP
jgi:hypothetical protein